MENRSVLMWLVMDSVRQTEFVKWAPQWWYTSFEQFITLNKNNLDKKSIAPLFYSNSLTSLLWSDYLFKYKEEDILTYFKHINSEDDQLKSLLAYSSEIKREITQSLTGISFTDKEKKQDENQSIQEWLFSFSLEGMKSSFEYVQEWFEELVNDSTNITLEPLSIQHVVTQRYLDTLKENIEAKWYFTKWYKNVIINKYPIKKKWVYIKKLDSERKDVYSFVMPNTEFKRKTEYLSIHDCVVNVAGNINIMWYVDKRMFGMLFSLFPLENWESQRYYGTLVDIQKLIIFATGSDKNKLPLMKKWLSEFEYNELEYSTNKKAEYVAAFTTLRKWVRKQKSVYNILSGIFDREEWNVILPPTILEKVLADNSQRVKFILEFITSTKAGENYLNILKSCKKIHKGLELTEQEKELFFFDHDWEKVPVDVHFEWEVIKFLWWYVSKIKNEYIDGLFAMKFLSNTNLYTTYWYIKGTKIMVRWAFKTIIEVIGKGTVDIGTFDQNPLLVRLEWPWYYSLSLNYFGKKYLHSLAFSETQLWDDIIWDRYFSKTLISAKNIMKNNTFYSKLTSYLKDYVDDLDRINNVITSFDKTYFYIRKLSNESLVKYNKPHNPDETYYFISEGDISVIMSENQIKQLCSIKAEKEPYKLDNFYYSISYYNKTTKEKVDLSQVTKQNVHTFWALANIKYRDSSGVITYTKQINTNITHFADKTDKQMNTTLFAFYTMYYEGLFDTMLKMYKWVLIYDLEAFVDSNILLWYFVLVMKKWVYVYKYSNEEYWDFFDYYTTDPNKELHNIAASVKDSNICISGHNIKHFDNKKVMQELWWDETLKENLDANSLDTLAILQRMWFGKLGLDKLSTVNFAFGKNIKKWWYGKDLIEEMKMITDIARTNDFDRKKEHYWSIKNFVTYNKNDVIMSMWVLGQMLKRKSIRTPKWIAHITDFDNELVNLQMDPDKLLANE